jgi:hypothetical protein
VNFKEKHPKRKHTSKYDDVDDDDDDDIIQYHPPPPNPLLT